MTDKIEFYIKVYHKSIQFAFVNLIFMSLGKYVPQISANSLAIVRIHFGISVSV